MGGETVSPAASTRRAARATLPARGRDLNTHILVQTAMRMLFRLCHESQCADAAPSLPFTGRVAREAGRVGFIHAQMAD